MDKILLKVLLEI